MIGSMEPDFRFLTCRAVLCRGLSKAWQKKIPQRSEDDFLLANQPLKGAALRNPRQRTVRQVRNRKTGSTEPIMSNKLKK